MQANEISIESKNSLICWKPRSEASSMNQSNNEEYYRPFYNALMDGHIPNIKTFIDSHPHALTDITVDDGDIHYKCTALHYVLRKFDRLHGGEAVVAFLVKLMTSTHLEILDMYKNTPLVTAVYNRSCPVDVLELMVNKNPNLAQMGSKFPVYIATEYMLKDATHYLYRKTDTKQLFTMGDKGMALFFKNLVRMNLFEDATDFVNALPSMHRDRSYYTVSALGRKFVSPGFKAIESQVLKLLNLVCSVQSRAYDWFDDDICGVIVENAESDSMEFVEKLFQIRPDILKNRQCRAKLLSRAVEKREKNIFNLIYSHIEEDDLLKSYHSGKETDTKNNILHLATNLAPSYVLVRKSGAVLQMQRELQWFQEVRKLASLECLQARNGGRFTPRELLIETHKSLKEAGEKSMKEIAQSCTVVGALIVTIMFAAAFTLPGGNDQNTGLPVLLKRIMFKVFIICDAISLHSSTTSVLTCLCLGILSSRYAEDDFLLNLPRKLMIALSALFFSIATMMVAFRAALTIMLDGKLQLVFPIVLVSLVPIGIFLYSTFPLLYDMYVSTYRPGILDENNAKLLQKTKHMRKP